jgi:hypothetical protein
MALTFTSCQQPRHYCGHMTLPVEARSGLAWARNPLGRVLGSFASWFLFSLCMSLLVQGMFGLMAVGGSCADGGPYVSAQPCPDAVALFMPLSVFGGLASVALALAFSNGFGVSLLDLAWPILFCGLGGGFLFAFAATGDPTGLIIGVLFEAMGLVPLVLALRASAQRVFLGAVNARGERFYEGETVRFSLVGVKYSTGDSTVPPTFGDWSASLLVWVLAMALGYYAAVAAYAAV